MEPTLLKETIDVLTSFIVYLNRKEFDLCSNDSEMLYFKQHYTKLCNEKDKRDKQDIIQAKLRRNHNLI